MSKQAKTVLKALERSQATTETLRSRLTAAMAVCPTVEMEACAALVAELEAYLRANARLQQAINAGYGDSPREIAAASIKSKHVN